jgi:hypothetical protein
MHVQTCCYGASRRVDVQVDRLLWIVRLEEEELCDDRRGYGLVNLAIEANYSFLETQQMRKHAILPFRYLSIFSLLIIWRRYHLNHNESASNSGPS